MSFERLRKDQSTCYEIIRVDRFRSGTITKGPQFAAHKWSLT